MLNDTGGLKN